MERQYYTSDYVLGDPSIKYAPFRIYDEKIARYKEMKVGLEELYNNPEQTPEMKDKISEVISNVDHFIAEFEDIRYKRLEEGVYKREWYNKYPNKTVQTFKRVDGDSCDDCVFRHMPCLGIRSHYGCHTTPEYSPNNETRNGKLIKQGHFIEIERVDINKE